MSAFTSHDSAAFADQGYLLLRNFLTPEVVGAVRDEIAAWVARLAQARGVAHRFADEPFETRLIRLFEDAPEDAPRLIRPELHLPGLFPLFFHPGLLDLVEAFLGPEIRLYPNYSVRPKRPQSEAGVVLWHQDGGYTAQVQSDPGSAVDALRMINVWTPLVTAHIEQGCMEFVPGSHRLGVVPHLQKPHYLEIAPEHLAPHLENAIAIEMDPGDVVLFHNLLFHRGLPNRSQIVRWSADWRYQDATQPTLRNESGHLARSRAHPERVVADAADWASRRFT